MVKFLMYLGRWQASSVVLAPVLMLMTDTSINDSIWATVVANVIGGCVFFWVDRWIFKEKRQDD